MANSAGPDQTIFKSICFSAVTLGGDKFVISGLLLRGKPIQKGLYSTPKGANSFLKN